MFLVLFSLYVLGMVLAGLVGFCDASGRIGFIFKRDYYLRAIGFSIVLSQLNWLLAWVGFLPGLWFEPDLQTHLSLLTKAGSAALYVYGSYTLLVGLAFLGYAIPNTEARSFFTVAIFGPLTLLLPFVVLVGLFAAILTHPSVGVIAFFTPCALYMMLFKRLLGKLDAWERSLPPQWKLTF